MNNRGIRSGRERSSPTWGHGCRGVTGWRKPVDLAHGPRVWKVPNLKEIAFLRILIKRAESIEMSRI